MFNPILFYLAIFVLSSFVIILVRKKGFVALLVKYVCVFVCLCSPVSFSRCSGIVCDL